MDRISNLSEDLILKILSSLPTKNVVSTTVLSKRWRFLWMMVPKLDFNDGFVTEPYKYERFMTFVERSMVLRSVPVLQTLKLDVGPCCSTEDMARWIRIGMVQDVRELEIAHFEEHFEEEHRLIKLPNTLYTYEKLEVLKLTYSIILDVPNVVCFPSLKTLHLMCVEYKTKESFRRLLSGCSVLEELVLEINENRTSLRSFYVEIPTLQRLYVVDTYREPNYGQDKHHATVINVPSLKYLSFVDFYSDWCLCKNMPEVVEANVKVVYKNPEKLLKSLPSVKRLYLCLSASTLSRPDIGFYHLVHLELCAYSPWWWDLLTWMLKISPKLQVLKICECNERPCTTKPIEGHWRGPSSFPECLMFHLHIYFQVEKLQNKLRRKENSGVHPQERKTVEDCGYLCVAILFGGRAISET